MSSICLRRVRSFASVPAERGEVEDSRYAPGHVVKHFNKLYIYSNLPETEYRRKSCLSRYSGKRGNYWEIANILQMLCKLSGGEIKNKLGIYSQAS